MRHDERVADDRASGMAEPPHGGVASGVVSGVVSLRRELWRRHVQLRDIGPDDLRYIEAAGEVLDLTTRLLTAEEAVDAAARAAHRRASAILYCLALGASAAVIAMVALLPGLGAPVSRVAVGTVLVLLLLTGIALVRWRHSRSHPSAAPGERTPATDPVTDPLVTPSPTVTPNPTAARSS